MLNMSRMRASILLFSPAGVIGEVSLELVVEKVGHARFSTDRGTLHDEVFVANFHTVQTLNGDSDIHVHIFEECMSLRYREIQS